MLVAAVLACSQPAAVGPETDPAQGGSAEPATSRVPVVAAVEATSRRSRLRCR